jgi:hypothetical protein
MADGKSKDKSADPLVDATTAAVGLGEAVIEAEARLLAEAMALAGTVASPRKPETEAERLRHEAEVEEGFDNLPV